MTAKIVSIDTTTGAESMIAIPVTGNVSKQSVIAGENITGASISKLVYIDSSDGKAYNATNADATKAAEGFVSETVTADGEATVTVNFSGIMTESGLTTGADYFLATAGAVGAANAMGSGVIGQRVGYAISATELVFHPYVKIAL